MKIILTRDELSQAIQAHYPVPAEYVVGEVAISPYGKDFCVIELEKANVEALPANVYEVKAAEAEQAALRA